jgi:hypothetical protein
MDITVTMKADLDAGLLAILQCREEYIAMEIQRQYSMQGPWAEILKEERQRCQRVSFSNFVDDYIKRLAKMLSVNLDTRHQP